MLPTLNATAAPVAAIQPEFILGTAEITRACEHITEKGQKLDDFIQYTALSVLNHVELHGDISVANKLYLSMPKGSRKTALADFMLKYGKLLPEQDRLKGKTAPFIFGRDKVTNLEAARAKPWYEHKKDPEVIDTLNIHAMIAALVARIERDANKGAKVDESGGLLLADLKLLSARPAPVAEAVNAAA